MDAGKRYTIAEIAEATGILRTTLQGRKRRMGIEGSVDGYTLEQVKQLIKRPAKSKRKTDKRLVADLQRKLKNDGYL